MRNSTDVNSSSVVITPAIDLAEPQETTVQSCLVSASLFQVLDNLLPDA